MWHSQLLEVSPGKEKPWIWETWAEMRSPSQDTCKWHEKWVLIFTCLACNLSLGYLTKGCLVHFWWEDSALSLKLSFFLLPTLPQHTLSLIWNFKWLCKIAHVPWCFNFPPKSIGMLPVSAWQIRAVDLCQANQSFFLKLRQVTKRSHGWKDALCDSMAVTQTSRFSGSLRLPVVARLDYELEFSVPNSFV